MILFYGNYIKKMSGFVCFHLFQFKIQIQHTNVIKVHT